MAMRKSWTFSSDTSADLDDPNSVWVKVNEFDNCYWIPLANGETFTWVEGIPYCPKGADTGESIGL